MFQFNKILYSIKLIGLFILLPFVITAQQKKAVIKQINNRGEVYLLIDVPNQKTLSKLNKITSIDKRIYSENANKVYAYVSKNNIEQFNNLNLNYLLQTPPSLKLTATMCTDINDVKSWSCYPAYDQYITLMNKFVSDFPDICKLEEIGTSVDGRSVLSLKISDNILQSEEEPRFFYTSSMHGDEIAGYYLMIRLIDYMLNNYEIDNSIKSLIDNAEIWINPLANPDGTFSAGNSSVTGATRYNSNNFDLNRNFPDPLNGEYPNGSRQKETQDMMDFMKAKSFVLSANFHGGAEVVNYPWDSWESSVKKHADNDWYINLSRQYADTVHKYSSDYMTGFTAGITNGADWYSIDGGRQDYVNYYLHSMETTIELSSVKTPDASKLPQLWDYNYRSLINYISNVNFGLFGKVTDEDGIPIKAKIFIENHDKDSSEVYSDINNGMYYRLMEGGTYSVKFSAVGFKTKVLNDVSFSDKEHKRLDVILEKEIVSIEKNEQIKIYKINNPFSNLISGEFYLNDYEENLSISLYDSKGRLCKKLNPQNIKRGGNSFLIETNSLKSGLYILYIRANQFSIRKKMIKP